MEQERDENIHSPFVSETVSTLAMLSIELQPFSGSVSVMRYVSSS